MYTYIMKGGDLYKIGKTNNVQIRLKTFQTSNPYIELVKTIEGNYEKWLHQKFKDKWVIKEWFKLTTEDIESIELPVIELPSIKIPKVINRLVEKPEIKAEPKARIYYSEEKDAWMTEMYDTIDMIQRGWE